MRTRKRKRREAIPMSRPAASASENTATARKKPNLMRRILSSLANNSVADRSPRRR